MSTSTQIAVYKNEEKKLEDFEVMVYRHSNGHPEGVLPELVPFLEYFKNARGLTDTEYLGARMVQYLTNLYDKHGLEFGNGAPADIEKLTGVIGYGISKNFHINIEYFYKVFPTKLEVWKVTGAWDEPMEKRLTKLVKTVTI